MKIIKRFLLGVMLLSTPLFANPQVVVTIKPLYSVAAWMMKGIGTPELLMKEKASPHHFHLLPSHIEKLNTADIFLWVGPDMETEFAKTVSTLDEKKVITGMKTEGVQLLSVRGDCGCCHEHHHDHGIWHSFKKTMGKLWGWMTGWCCSKDKIDHKHGHHGHHHHHGKKSKDPHIWTNPDNVLAMANELKNRLIKIDEKNSEIYKKNYEDFSVKISKLKAKMASSFIKDTPFVLFHDSLQYLEKYAGLKNGYAVKGGDESGFSLQEIMKLKERLKTSTKNCILTDEELSVSKITEMVGTSEGLKIKEISPEGIHLEVTDDIYFHMMEDLVSKIEDCLS